MRKTLADMAEHLKSINSSFLYGFFRAFIIGISMKCKGGFLQYRDNHF